VAQLVEATGNTRTLLLVNFRPEYTATWSGRSYYQQLPLTPLGPEEVAEMVMDLLGSDESVAPLPALIQEKTGGNPFFTEEVVQSLVESEALRGERGAYRLVQSLRDLEVPATVQALLGARIDRLSEQEKQVLHTAAVIGREFNEPLLSAVVDLASEDLLSCLNRLKSAEFILEQAIYPVAEYAFKHPLTEQVARESQLQERRRRTHAAVARAIEAQAPERLDENAALLAHHFEEAGESADAVQWHQQAAEWASRSNPLDGLRHWRRVVELGRETPSTPELDAIRLQGCRAFLVGGTWRLGLAPGETEALVAEGEEIAQRLNDSASHAALLQAGSMRLLGILGRTQEAIEVQGRALALAARSDDRETHAAARAGSTHVLGMTGRLEESLQSARAQCELCEGDPSVGIRGIGYSVLVHGLLFQAWMSAWLGRIGEARALAERTLALAREVGQREMFGFMSGITAHIAFLAGDREGAKGLDLERTILELIEIAEELGSPYQFHTSYRDLGLAHLLLGRPEDAVACLERALGPEYHMALDLEGWARAWLAAARLAAGDISGARRAADEAVTVTVERGLRIQECLARVMLAKVHLADADATETERVEAALDAAERLAAEIAAGALSPQITELRAELARLRGELSERGRLLRQAHHLYTEMGATGHAERLAGELGL
jgi:adenylate cyclase